MSSLALSKVTSSLHVICKTSDARYNLGLNLKFDSKKKKVLGYSQKTPQGWEYSQKAVDVLKEYRERFPEFFNGIERKSRTDFYEDTDFYPADVAEKKMGAMKDWLKNLGAKEFEKVGLETRALVKSVVEVIEERVQEVYARIGELKYKPVTVKNIPRPAVLKPAHARHRLGHQVFDLGDRVLYAVDSGTVPIGWLGTVIGLEDGFVDVLFDRDFMGGTRLGDRYVYRPIVPLLVVLFEFEPWQTDLYSLQSARTPWTHRKQGYVIESDAFAATH